MFGQDKPKAPEANEALIQAFVSEYTLVMTEEEADEVFDMCRLREYFGAFQVPKMPDPLPPYLDALTEDHGYQFRTSYSGDAALFLKKTHKPIIQFTPSLGWEDDYDAGDVRMLAGDSGTLRLPGNTGEDEEDDIFRMAGYDDEDEDEDEDENDD